MHHEMHEERELTSLQKLYVPEYEVEPSFFFYPNRGRKHEKLPLKEKLKMQLDEVTHKFLRPDSLEGYADPVVITSGIFLQCVAIGTLFAL